MLLKDLADFASVDCVTKTGPRCRSWISLGSAVSRKRSIASWMEKVEQELKSLA